MADGFCLRKLAAASCAGPCRQVPIKSVPKKAWAVDGRPATNVGRMLTLDPTLERYCGDRMS